MDGADLQFREVARIPNLTGRSAYAIAQFKGGLLRESTDNQFTWRRFAEQDRNYLAGLDVTSCYRKRTGILTGLLLPTL